MRLFSIIIVVMLIFSGVAEAQAPEVISVFPIQNNIGASVNNTITVGFNIAIDALTVTGSSFIVQSKLSGPLAGTFFLTDFEQTIIFTPNVDFFYGDEITVLLTTGIESQTNTPLSKSFDWSFTIECGSGPGTFEPDAIYNTGDWPWEAIAGDFDNDGDIDLANNNGSGGSVSILKNNGNGIFGTHSTYPTSSSPASLVAADLDNDNDLDLAVACLSSDHISILINNGTGSFSNTLTITVGDLPEDICAADFNADGNMDLATADYGDYQITVLFGNGDGTFPDTAVYPCNGWMYSIGSGDLDNDGDIDLAALDMHNADITILLNNGDGTYGPVSEYPTGWQPMGFDLGDFNHDGYLDIAASSVGSDALFIHLNDGTGSFTDSTSYPSGDFPLSVSASDLNGNGVLDIIVASSESFHAYIHSGNGDGTFTLSTRSATDRYPSSVIAADFDGDNDMDLAAVNRGSDNISIMFNQEISTEQMLVINLEDSGVGSFRWALDSANNHAGIDSITFAVKGSIQLLSALPPISGDGGTHILGSSVDNYPYRIELNGSNLVSGHGLEILSSDNMVEGMKIGEFPWNGITVISETAIQNRLSENLIYENGLLGIDLGNDGVTLNDPGDSDSGPNNLINYPVIDSSYRENDTSFNIYGHASPGDKIELFHVNQLYIIQADPDPSGHGEAPGKIYSYPGENYADENGDFSFFNVNPNYGGTYSYVTATATDSFGNSSEFSENANLLRAMEFTAYSPVNLWITDPNGDYMGKDENGVLYQSIPTAEYLEGSLYFSDRIIINHPYEGQYLIEIIPETGADPEATYSFGTSMSWFNCMLCVNTTIPTVGTKDTLIYIVEDGWHYKNGDADRNNELNILDITYLVEYMYKGGPSPYPETAGDANCNLAINLLDITYLINYLYKGGPEPCEILEK